VAVQANRYEGYTVWINALTEGAGVSIIQNPGADPKNLKLGLDQPGAEKAAAVIKDLVDAGVAGPAVSTQDEEASRALFQSDKGGFMANWPYIWQAANGEADAGTLNKSVIQDIGWTLYPRTVADHEAAPPFGGIILGIGAFTKHPQEALDAASCITTNQHKTQYMLSSGNPSAAVASYDDPKVEKQFPMASTIRESLQMAKPRPQTPFYNEVSESLQRTYHPPSSVDPQTTPQKAADLITAVLNKEALL
jgi:multiple sugar transport system substrate-binding protein